MEETIKKIEDGELVALFSICNKEELDPIVKVLMGQKSCSLDKEYNYKKFAPDHTKYYKSIVSELRLFGGNSLVNLTRKGQGVSYNEIVFDVCERLGIPRTKNETISNEETLLRLYELEAEKVSENKFDITGEVLKSILPRLALGPVGLLSLPLQAAGAAYRVTVPCVIEIAQLRQKKIKEYYANNENNHNIMVITPSQMAEIKSNIISIENDQGEVALSLRQLPESFNSETLHNLDSTSTEQHQISQLNPLLQALPALATAYDVNTTRYMEIAINGPLTQARSFAEDGAYRAITKGADGKIIENAKLFEPSQLSKLVSAGALFQIASVAVAQKHLADISQKLTEIKSIVEEVVKHLKDKREAEILGAISYLEQVSSSVIEGERSSEVIHKIEAKESHLIDIQHHLLIDISNFNSNLELKNPDNFGMEGLVDILKSQQEKIKGYYNQLLLCIRARACGWQLLSFCPNRELSVKSRKDSLKNDIQNLDENSALLKKTEQVLIKEIKAISSIFNTNTTLNERKLQLLDLNQSIFANLSAEKKKIELEIEDAETFVSNLKAPVTNILVKVENQKIVATNVMGF